MEFDTGAARSIISKLTFDQLFEGNLPPIRPTAIRLHKFGNVPIQVLGEAIVNANLHGVSKPVVLIVTKENGPSLFGRNWMTTFGFDFSTLFSSSSRCSSSECNVISPVPKSEVEKAVLRKLENFTELFKPELGTFLPHPVTIDLDPACSPRFLKARPVPYSLKSKVDEEIDRLISEQIIFPVPHSDWACPAVPVVKPNGKIRLCGDYKLTANKAIKMDSYPVPKPLELLSTLAGGKYFAKLDMSHAYNQLVLTEESKPCTTLNTHRGLFRYNRLCFGVSTAPGVFQRTMETLLKGCERTLVFFDDITISGTSPDDFLANLHKVLTLLQNSGIRLNKEKCQWCLSEVTYLGFRINSEGIQPTNDKLLAIRDAPPPQNKTELQSYLGLINFYRMFLPNASTFMEPLNILLCADTPWNWGKDQQKAFQTSKDVLLGSNILVHFDPSLPMVVSADCSSYGIGACLAHVIDGVERPVFFASRTLNIAERNYSQVEREALALVFALKRFHFYVYGHKFTLKTDHKPLLGLFSADRSIPLMASGRIQRWCLMLQAYNFSLVHTSGKLLGNVDALSRLPLKSQNESVPIPAEWVHTVKFFNSTPVNADHIAKFTSKDPVLARVYNFCRDGWPSMVYDEELKPFFQRREELFLQSGCLLWGHRVVIPEKFRAVLLQELHSEHVGSTRMKQLARSYLWWPKLDSELEALVQKCEQCLQKRHAPHKCDLH